MDHFVNPKNDLEISGKHSHRFDLQNGDRKPEAELRVFWRLVAARGVECRDLRTTSMSYCVYTITYLWRGRYRCGYPGPWPPRLGPLVWLGWETVVLATGTVITRLSAFYTTSLPDQIEEQASSDLAIEI